MSAPVPGSKERAALDKLRMLRVAKDLFLSEWYLDACQTLDFSPAACRVMGDIAEESREERDDALRLIRDWAMHLTEARENDAPGRVAHVARRDFLLHLIDVKEAAGETFERAALLAPLSMREEFERLAAIDFRHAIALRQLLVDEVQSEWRHRTRGHAGPDQPR